MDSYKWPVEGRGPFIYKCQATKLGMQTMDPSYHVCFVGNFGRGLV